MAQYFTLFFIVLLVLYVAKNGHNTQWTLISTVLLFFLFFAFRVGFTPDYDNYEEYYNRCHGATLDPNSPIEIGFQWICQILPSYRALIIVYTALFSLCMYISLKVFINVRYWILAVAILFIHTPFVLGNMSGLRSGIVTCLVFIAVILRVSFRKDFFILSIGVLLVSTLFHRSAIALLPLLLLPKQPFGRGAVKMLYFLAAIFVFVSLFFGSQLNNLAVSVSGELFDDRYDMYLENYNQTGFNLAFLLKEIVVAILLNITLRHTQAENNPRNNYFIKLTAISYLFLLVPQGIGLISRYQYYFTFLCAIGIPCIIGGAKKKTKLVYSLCLSFLAFWDLFFLLRDSIVYYTDYNTILF